MKKQADQQTIKDVAAKIVERFQPMKVVLFGSWAWGEPGPDSDVDLFIVTETQDTRQLAREIDGSIFPRPFPLDLIVYRPDQVESRTEQGDPFISEILSRGTVLYDE